MYADLPAERLGKSRVVSHHLAADDRPRRRLDWAAVAPLLIGGPVAFVSIVLLAWSLSYLLYL